ncbi:MAG: hypothetical protein K2F81_06775, partial [Ruminococcus sp.]|nr:hypothetical protein [Ruminococcus sp.]
MNICNSCNYIFDDQVMKCSKENMGEHFGSPYYESSYLCPRCKSDDISEINKCEVCGEYEIELTLCEDCKSVSNTNLTLPTTSL